MLTSLQESQFPTYQRSDFGRPAGLVYSVKLCDPPEFISSGGRVLGRGAKRQGKLYERFVVEQLEKVPGYEGFAGQWITWNDENGCRRHAQPDWFGLDGVNGRVLLVEVKLSRVPKAYWQLNYLYKPLIQKLLPKWEIACLEVAANVQPTKDPVRVVHEYHAARVGETSFMKVHYGR